MYNVSESSISVKTGKFMNLGEKVCDKVLRSSPAPDEVKGVEMGEKGRVKFRVSLSFLTGGDSKLESEVAALDDFSRLGTFYIDSIGQHLVRKNLSSFLRLLEDMTEEDYQQKLMMFTHIHFSMQMSGKDVEVSLHVSYLHDMLLDHFLFRVEEKKDAD